MKENLDDLADFDHSMLYQPGTVLIDCRNIKSCSGYTHVFTEPSDLITALTPDEVASALRRLDEYLEYGFYIAGYLGYEAGLNLDKPIISKHKQSMPLIWLGVYKRCLVFDSETLDLGCVGELNDISDIRLNITEDDYLNNIRIIKEYITAGDIYQLNFTCKLLFEHHKPALHLFSRLRKAHPVCHSAFINTGDMQIVSLSPELFLERAGKRVLTRPMKGTSSRGRWFEEDIEIARQLPLDIKNRAENVMILDLMRNDLGRVCVAGGVSVPEMFKVEAYRSLFQMTSDVEGILRDEISVSDILKASFPPGSITGAPKIRAMEIIDQLEHESRGVYCGNIGMFRPGGDCLLNVAIRTIIQRGSHCEMGVGSGIVADSEPNAELRETLLKGQFLRMEPPKFKLLETLLYRVEIGYVFLDEHLRRMEKSSLYFGWRFPEQYLRNALLVTAADIEASRNSLSEGNVRVRLLLSQNGECYSEWSDTGTAQTGLVNLLLAETQTDPADVFLYHKTTQRDVYDKDIHEARKNGYFDLIYTNIYGELTEGSITNLAVELDRQWYTPPLNCGLLSGIWRQSFIDAGTFTERILSIEDLYRATRVMVGNSVRGSLEVGSISQDGKIIGKTYTI
ncbi:MAG: aminodeoxychorismate synthase component I [Armatimonadota bacterium]